MKRKDVDKLLKDIQKSWDNFKDESDFCVVGVKFKSEESHTHVKTFVKSEYGPKSSLIGFYLLTADDMAYIKEVYKKECFFQEHEKGCTIIKIYE